MCSNGLLGPNICCGIVIGIVLVCMVPFVFIPWSVNHEYDSHQCFIDKIVYPTHLPPPDNTTGWGRCDCGKRCWTWTPCIQIYTNVSDSVIARDEFYRTSGHCSYPIRHCPDGEDLTKVQEDINQAKEVYDRYINQTVDCYYNDDIDYIFLEKEWDWSYTILFIVLLTIFVCACVTLNVCACLDDRRKRKEREANVSYAV